MKLLAGLLAAALLWDLSGWDLAVSRAFGSAAGFAARDAFWARTVLHEGLRAAFVLLFAAAMWQAVRAPQPGPTRAEHGRALLLMALAWLLVPLLKQHTLSSCPWSLGLFGGEAQWVSHWRVGVPDGGPGHCFPAGHATGGFAFFALLALWWPWRAQQPGLARFWVAVPWLAGGLASVAQVARGAHFVSHCLWAAALCGLMCALLSAWLRRRRAVAPERPSPVPA